MLVILVDFIKTIYSESKRDFLRHVCMRSLSRFHFTRTLCIMADIIRSAKSGNDWTRSDLDSYHITIHQVDHLLRLTGESRQLRIRHWEDLTIFTPQELPQPVIDQELLNILDADAMQQDRNAGLIVLLDLAMIPDKGETAANDFAVKLFKVLGYVRRQRLARTRVDLPLLICGEERHAKTDVCIVDRSQNDILLLVQADKRLQ